jgi:tRNA pseudouridine38-40 synthase
MRFRITIEYSGKNYNGWQRQENGIGVQQVIEDTLSELTGEKIVITGSGRTDTGVHAAGQVAHFDSDTKIPPEKLVFAMNALLPDDVKLTRCEIVDENFHAQYSAKRKTYRYQTYISRIPSPLKDDYYAQVIPPVDIEKVRRAAKKLVGVHDFKAFCSSSVQKKSTVREIYSLKVIHEGDILAFEVEGNGFLYNMVRIIVGTLIYIGRGKLAENTIDEMLATGIRKLGGKTFPAKGLCLIHVEYEK